MLGRCYGLPMVLGYSLGTRSKSDPKSTDFFFLTQIIAKICDVSRLVITYNNIDLRGPKSMKPTFHFRRRTTLSRHGNLPPMYV